MAPERMRLVRQLTFVLLALASAAVDIAAVDTRPVLSSFGLTAVWLGIAALVAWWLPAPADPAGKPPLAVLGLLLLLGSAPFLVEPLRRSWTGDGYPLELQMVLAFRNVGLGLAACSGWRLCLRLASFASLFLILFAAAMTNHPAVLLLLGLYTAVGSLWLMLVYWSGLGKVLLTGEQAVVELQPDRQPFSWLALGVCAVLLGLTCTTFALGPRRLSGLLGEWMSTSGGTGLFDPYARGGVNDGDDETSGDNPNSTGMTQTETFLESPLPTLYDMINDLYGEPFRPRQQEAAIALDPSTRVIENKSRTADNLRPSRSFPTARQTPKNPGIPPTRKARALFEVQGRTPLHVRVLAYDSFDGQAWHEAPVRTTVARIEKDPRSNWMSLLERSPLPIFAVNEEHQFKLTDPSGSWIPTPPHLIRFRIGRADQPDFFSWGQDRILRFARRTTPSGIVVETVSRSVDPRLLAGATFTKTINERFDYLTLPESLEPQVSELARSWVAGVPPGWPVIAAVVERLRRDYVLDRTVQTTGQKGATPIEHFLFTAQRGPDYQFASAACLLLRSLGYPTRLVSGFYVHPEHYDAETGHTPVVKEDLHFWPEVFLANGDWLVLEPTPGYELPGPNLPLTERLWQVLVTLSEGALRYWMALTCLAVLGLVIALRWRQLLDGLAVLAWRCYPGRTWRDQVRQVLMVLERRGRWMGQGRGVGQTRVAWLKELLHTPLGSEEEVRQLMYLAEWSAYAPAGAAPWPEEKARQFCQQVLQSWTLARWHQARHHRVSPSRGNDGRADANG